MANAILNFHFDFLKPSLNVCVCVGSIWGQQGVLVIAAPKRKRLAFDGEEQQDVQEGGGEGGEELKDEEDEEGDPAEPGCRPEVQLTTG